MVLMASLLGLLSVSVFASAPVSAWEGAVDIKPGVVYQGDVSPAFEVVVQNTGTASLDVNWIYVEFCWDSSGNGTYFKEDDGQPVTISAGAFHTFTSSAPVPNDALGYCVVDIEVNGQAIGDWWATTRSYSPLIEVDELPPFADMLVAMLIIVLIVVIVVVALVFFLAVRRRPRVPYQQPYQPQYQQQYQQPPQQQQPGQYRRPGQPP